MKEFFTKLVAEKTVKKNENKLVVLNMLLDFKETDKALNYLMNKILVNIKHEHLAFPFWNHKQYAAIEKKVSNWIKEELKQNMIFSNEPYTAAWLFYKMSLPAAIVAAALIIDLKNDKDVVKGNYKEVREQVSSINKPEWNKFIQYIRKDIRKNYSWLLDNVKN
jgi:hypothetical protein